MRNILLVLPNNNFNEHEFLVVKKVLEQNAFNLLITSDSASLCFGNNGLKTKSDVNIMNVHPANFLAVVIIGGTGINELWNSKNIHKIVKEFYQSEKVIAAICGAPVILARAGLLKGTEATCFEEHRSELESESASYLNIPVVKRGRIITGQNPEAADEFARTIVNTVNN